MSLCVTMSYSLWTSLRTRAEFHAMECGEDFPLAWAEVDRCRFLVAARSSSIRYPHTLNYTAFARELKRVGCTHLLSNAVCSALDADAVTPSFMIPDQFIDLHCLAAVETPAGDDVVFEDFSFPWCEGLRSEAIHYLSGQSRCAVSAAGCYVGVDGPRSRTAAEVQAYRILGGNVVGMTAVREAVARRGGGYSAP